MEKYKYSVNCKNCGVSQLAEQAYGQERPVKATCTNCGCTADTAVTNFNKNISFPYEQKYC